MVCRPLESEFKSWCAHSKKLAGLVDDFIHRIEYGTQTRQGPHLTWRSHFHQKVGWGTWLESFLITERDWFQTDQNIDESLETGGLLEVVRAFCKSFEKMFWTFSTCFMVDLSCLRRRNRKHKEVLYWRGENKRGTMFAYMSHLLLLGKFEYTGGPIFKVVLEC